MKSILLIGLGRFGRHIAMHLNELGHQVMAVDKVEERVDAVLPYVTNAQIGDSTNGEFLESLGIRNFDVCIVAIGNDFQSSLETTSLLKELGGKLVVSRAARDVQAKFLLRNGADEVVYPEKQLAKWTAIRYSADHILDYMELVKNVYRFCIHHNLHDSFYKNMVAHEYAQNSMRIRKCTSYTRFVSCMNDAQFRAGLGFADASRCTKFEKLLFFMVKHKLYLPFAFWIWK